MNDPKPRPRWKLLLWAQAILLFLWIILKNVPRITESGAGGATDLLLFLLAILILLIWLLFLSRLHWKTRLISLTLAISLLGLVKIDGLSGSFFPEFSWRWSKISAKKIPKITGKIAQEGSLIKTQGPKNFPRLLGAEMSNHVSGELLPPDWFTSKPRELWRKKIGEGWSSFSVAGDYAFTMEQLGKIETTLCYQLTTGDPVWVHEEQVRFEESMGADGPRSTPTIANGKVYSYGATGILNCLDARTGQKIWGKDVVAAAHQSVPKWAKSCSPLVIDNKVIVTLGSQAEKNLAAFDANTGTQLWRSGDYPSSYTSPVVATLAGKKQVLR